MLGSCLLAFFLIIKNTSAFMKCSIIHVFTIYSIVQIVTLKGLFIFFSNMKMLNPVSRFEQAFINSLLKEHISTEVMYFWIGLQDSKGSGEYQWISQDDTADRVTYTNWKWLEPGNLLQFGNVLVQCSDFFI